MNPLNCFARFRGTSGARGLLLLWAALLGSDAHAETAYNVGTNTGSGITVKFTTPLTFSPRFGFLPVRVFVENNSDRDGTWRFHFTAGSPNEFPGEVGSGLELAVASRQNREAWYYVPLALPGVVANELNLAAAVGGRGGPGGPSVPQIPGVVPAPQGLQRQNTRQIGSRVVNGVLETTFQITQTGPATLLRVIPQSSLPPRTTMSVTSPDLTGNVTRTTTIVVQSAVTPTSPASPAAGAISMVVSVARTRLGGAGVPNMNRTQQTSSEVSASTTPGLMDVKVTFRHQGAPSQLVLPSRVTLPPAFTVSITPLPTGRGGQAQVERVITYTEQVPIPPGFTPPPPNAVPVPTTMAPATILVRSFAAQNFSINVEMAGPGLPTGARQSLSGSLNSAQGATPPLAASPGADPFLRSQFLGVGSMVPLLSLVDPVTVPADWRVWSSFHSVVMTEAEFTGLDSARQAALRGWAAMGGFLTLVGPAAGGQVREQRLGAGWVRTVPNLDGRSAAELAPLLRLDTSNLGLPERVALDLKETTLGTEVADTGSSATWLITFLLLFAALIGPVNLWVFARGQARHRLFWTTPALALLGGLTLAIVILVQDGIGGEGRRAAIVALLPGQNQAAIFQEQASRTGYLTQRAFGLADDVLLAGMPVEGIVAPVRQQVREAGRAEGDWFMNRSRQAHLLRQLVPSRGRIEQVTTAANGAPVVESSLPVELKSFVLVDAQGRRWTASEVLPGKATTLSPAPDSARLSAALLGGSAAFQQVLESVTSDLPGRWMAYGGKSDLAPIETLSSIEWKETRVAYTGVAESRVPVPAGGGAR
jgi:hypothetical protein